MNETIWDHGVLMIIGGVIMLIGIMMGHALTKASEKHTNDGE